MTDLPFHLDWVQTLVDHRQPLLTAIMQAITFSGEIQGYVLLIARRSPPSATAPGRASTSTARRCNACSATSRC
jgi:hypothetical protein